MPVVSCIITSMMIESNWIISWLRLSRKLTTDPVRYRYAMRRAILAALRSEQSPLRSGAAFGTLSPLRQLWHSPNPTVLLRQNFQNSKYHQSTVGGTICSVLNGVCSRDKGAT